MSPSSRLVAYEWQMCPLLSQVMPHGPPTVSKVAVRFTCSFTPHISPSSLLHRSFIEFGSFSYIISSRSHDIHDFITSHHMSHTDLSSGFLPRWFPGWPRIFIRLTLMVVKVHGWVVLPLFPSPCCISSYLFCLYSSHGWVVLAFPFSMLLHCCRSQLLLFILFVC